jgi:hypothetical protein
MDKDKRAAGKMLAKANMLQIISPCYRIMKLRRHLRTGASPIEVQKMGAFVQDRTVQNVPGSICQICPRSVPGTPSPPPPVPLKLGNFAVA